MMSTILLKTKKMKRITIGSKKMKMIDLGLKILHSCKNRHIVQLLKDLVYQLSLMTMALINRSRAQPSETLKKKSSHMIKMKMMIPQRRMKS